jgi:hypothetical protein
MFDFSKINEKSFVNIRLNLIFKKKYDLNKIKVFLLI